MYIQKSPGGSLFPYYYKGGEIHALKYGSFFDDEEALFLLMKAEEDFILKPNRHLRIWVDFYETNLTDTVLLKFAKNINNLKNNIIRLAIVGFSKNDSHRFKHILKTEKLNFLIPIKQYDDPEDAKTWLVSEGE